MNRMFRRLLSALLAIVMVISGLQFGGWTQEAKAATTAGKTIYFDVNGSTNFYNDGAVPVVLFKKGADTNAETVGDWAEMTYVKTDIYSAVIPEGATHVQFRRSNDTNSGSKAIELMDSFNYYQIKDSGWVFNWYNDLNWDNQTVIIPASYAGQTIYVTGNATVSLSDGTTVAGTQLTDQTGALINVYKYTFGTDVAEGTTFSIAIDGNTCVSGASGVDSKTPCFDTAQNAWVAYTEPVAKVTIYLAYPGNNKPTVWFVKDGNSVSKQEGIDSFEFDLNSTKYDGFYVGWDESAGNQTVQIGLDEIRAKIADKTKVQLTIGEWKSNDENRPYEWSEAAFLGDQSLNIPTGTFQKETSSYYVSTTFYDYYSDVELTGVNRNTLTSGFETGDGSNDKIQARTFNEAVSSYFNGKLSGTFKPLYFGEFTKAPQSYYLYDLDYNNVSGGANGKAHQGLVDGSLNGSNNVTMGEIELPYFNKEFLRGNNSANVAIGQVFENVQFPFKKNDEDYWEFDSSKADQTLRMKQDSNTAAYYLERVGSTGEVDAVDSKNNNKGSGFFPFNDKSESANAKKLNYAFGVRFDIPFTMTADGQYGEGEKKQDIVYNFSGDDDVWVFIDGKLALDIGGDHGRVEGYINFAEEKVWVDGIGTKSFADLGISVAANQQHTLTMFYMERGLWESNMKITFNFPQVNTFAVNMEVDTSGVDPLFINALKGNLSSFDVLVQNYATRGADRPAGTEPVVESRTYNSLDVGTESTVTYQGSPEQSEIQTDTGNKSGRGNVLLVKYKAQLNNTPDANGHRVIIKPEEGEPFNASDVSDYLQFDMYNEGMGSTGVPYVYLKDAFGNVISGWANNSIAYDGNNNTLTRNKWVTVKVDLKKLKGESNFDFANITEIQIGYWDSGYTFIDNITFHKKLEVNQNQTKFQTPQYEVPTYGSIAGGLTNATGAIYEQQKGEGGSQFYVIGSDGTITMADGDTALFTDQFRIGSYINLKETVDSDYYTTTWNLSEGNSVYMSGEGSVINDKRTESQDFAAENDEDGTLMEINAGVEKPNTDTLLYRSNARTDDVITPTHIEATFINRINTGSLKIQKEFGENGENLKGGAYTFTITYSNIFGQINGEINETVTLNTENGYSYTKSRIPVGTSYVIKEEDNANYTVTNVTKEGNDIGSGDVKNKSYTGIISLGEDTQDVITFTNDLKPEEENKVFFVEAGTETALPMGLEELTYFDETAKPESSEEALIHLEKTTTTDEAGSNVKFDAPYVKGDGETEPSKSVPNEKYTFTYSGKDNNGEGETSRLVTGTVTVYTFKASNDVYVFDFGLKSDLADTEYGNGLFQNDILFNEHVKDTVAAFTGLKKITGDTFVASIGNEQSTVTGRIGAALKQIETTNGASLDEQEKVIFQPKKFMDKVETFYYQTSIYASEKTEIISPADGVNLSASVKVMPASIVYYEDNFSSVITNGTAEGTPDTDREQGNGLTTQYGYDKAYTADNDYSSKGYTALAANDSIAFTFKGTGFDILTRTSDANLYVAVYDASMYERVAYEYKSTVNGETVTRTMAYAKKKADGTGITGPIKTAYINAYNENQTIYQIPLISMDLSEYYGTGEGKTMEFLVIATKTTGSEDLCVDGVRIYRPMGVGFDTLNSDDKVEAESAYSKAEGELTATVQDVRSLILGTGYTYDMQNPSDPVKEGTADTIKASLAWFDDNKLFVTKGTAVVECYTGTVDSGSIADTERVEQADQTTSLLAYAISGANNELYLTGEQYVVATVLDDVSENATLQLGMKAVQGNSKVQYLNKDGEWNEVEGAGNVTTATEMYYKVDLNTVWTVNGKKVLIIRAAATVEGEPYILSMTNIKYSGLTLKNPDATDLGEGVVIKDESTSGTFEVLAKNTGKSKSVVTISVPNEVKEFTIWRTDKTGLFVTYNTKTGKKTYGESSTLKDDEVVISTKPGNGITIYVVQLKKPADEVKGTYKITTTTQSTYSDTTFDLQ